MSIDRTKDETYTEHTHGHTRTHTGGQTTVTEVMGEPTPGQMEMVARLTKDVVLGCRILTGEEARFLVDAYYTVQDYRKASDNQVRSLTKDGEPCGVLRWLGDSHRLMENQIKRALDSWTEASVVGLWSKSVVGIGPVIAAGLLAHIDITKAPTLGHIESFAGIHP